MKRLVLAALVLLAVGAVGFAGGQEETEVMERPDGVLTVTVGYNPNELSEDEVAAFEDKNPETKINQIAADYNTLLSSVAAGDPPELFRTQHNQMPYFAVRELLQPIDSYIAASTVIDESDFEFSVNTFRYDKENYIAGEGPLYGLPKDYSVLFDFFYRKDIWEEAGVELPSSTTPMTYQEFGDAIEQLTIRDGDRTVRWGYHGIMDGDPHQALELFLAQMGQSLYADEELKEINIVDNPDAVEIARFIYDLAKDRLTDSPLDPADAWLGGNLAAENPRSALYHHGYWAGAMYNSPETADLFGYAPSPLWGDQWLNGGHVAGTMMFRSDESYMNDEAWKFMEYYHGGDPAIARAESGWGLPIQKSFRDMVPLSTELDRTRLEVTTNQLDSGNYYVINGNPWALEPIKTVWNKYWGQVLNDDISFDEFLARVEKESNDLILDGLNTLGEF